MRARSNGGLDPTVPTIDTIADGALTGFRLCLENSRIVLQQPTVRRKS